MFGNGLVRIATNSILYIVNADSTCHCGLPTAKTHVGLQLTFGGNLSNSMLLVLIELTP